MQGSFPFGKEEPKSKKNCVTFAPEEEPESASSPSEPAFDNISPDVQVTAECIHPKENQNKPNWLHQVRSGFQCILCDQSCSLDSDLEAHVDQNHPKEQIDDLDEPISLPSARVSTEGSSRSSSPGPSRPRVPVFLIDKNNEKIREPKTQDHTNKAQPPVRNAQYECLLGFMSPAEPLSEEDTNLQN